MPEVLAEALGQSPHHPPEPRDTGQRAHSDEGLLPPGLRGGEGVPRPPEQRPEACGVGDPTNQTADDEQHGSEGEQRKTEPADGRPGHPSGQLLHAALSGPDSSDDLVGLGQNRLDLARRLGSAVSTDSGDPGLELSQHPLDASDRGIQGASEPLVELASEVLVDLVGVDHNPATLGHSRGQFSRSPARRRQRLVDRPHHLVRVQVGPPHR